MQHLRPAVVSTVNTLPEYVSSKLLLQRSIASTKSAVVTCGWGEGRDVGDWGGGGGRGMLGVGVLGLRLGFLVGWVSFHVEVWGRAIGAVG